MWLWCGQCVPRDFTDFFRRVTLPSIIDHVLLHAYGGIKIICVLIRCGIGMFRFIPDWSCYGAGANDDYVDSIEHQLAAQTLGESFQSMLGCSIRTREWTAVLASNR